MNEITPLLGASLNATIGVPLAAIAAEVDPETCQLLGPVALVVQGLMGLIVMGSLVLKRAQEKPKRKWKVWLGDVGKQIVGQAFVHASNVLISDLIARHATHDNPCSLYALNILIDTTLGVVILFGFLKLSTKVMLKVDPTYKTGDYGNPFEGAVWARQAAVYVACLFGMKVVVLLLFWAFPALFKFANWALTWLPTDDAQVVFVMLIFPLVMNLFQFLTIDSILRSKSPSLSSSSAFLSPSADEEARRGFLEPSSEDLPSESDDDDDVNGFERQKRKHAQGRSGLDSGYQGATGSPPSPAPRPASESPSGSGMSTPRAQGQTRHAYPPTTLTAPALPPAPAPPEKFVSLDPEKGFSLPLPTPPPRHASIPPPPPPLQPGEEEEEDDWGADWGAGSDGEEEEGGRLTSLELRREIEGMVGNEEDGDPGDDWGFDDEKVGLGTGEERRQSVGS